MKTINLEEILIKKCRENMVYLTSNELHTVLETMKEACRQALELASENSKTMKVPYFDLETKEMHKCIDIWVEGSDDVPSFAAIVDKESIINTINQIE